MKIEKFNEALISPALSIPGTTNSEKIYTMYSKPIRQMVIDKFNKEGYKLYYYNDFQIIEITNIANAKSSTRNMTWLKNWGNFIFFLNDEEYALSLKKTNKCKELYDAYMKQAEQLIKLPESSIYYDILKMKK